MKYLGKFVIAHIITASLIISCATNDLYAKNGLSARFIAPVGSPPADSIVWSPMGDSLLVTAGDVGEGRAEVYILNIETGSKQVLLSIGYGDFVSSTWSPDGKQILIVARQNSIGSGAAGLWLFDIETGTLEYLLNSGEAAWSPDGKMIATFFKEDENTGSERIILHLINVETRADEIIYETREMKDFFGITWSPNGQALAFALGSNEPGDLYTLSIPSLQVVQITQNAKITDPVWSPNGDIIAYTSWPPKGIARTIHLINSIGQCDTQIPDIEHVWSPTWSSDGKYLGYIGSDGIYSVEIDKVIGRDLYQDMCQEGAK